MAVSYFDELVKENKLLRDALQEIANKEPCYIYQSANSHPDTNVAHHMQGIAKHALLTVERMQKANQDGSE